MSKSVGPVTMCSAKSLIGDVAVQMVLSLHHRNFHFLFKWSYLSTINTFTFFSNDPVSPSSRLSMSIQKSCLSIIKTFTFYSNGPISQSLILSLFSIGPASASQKHSFSIQMALPLHYQNFHFLNAVLFFHYLPGILRY